MIRTRNPAEASALERALRKAYVEVYPSPSVVERLEILGPGAKVAITCSPAKGVDETVRLTEILVQRGNRVIPHIAARAVRDRAHLKSILARFDDLGVELIFVPGGDAATPVGDYSCAFELLRDIAEIGHRIRYIGVGAHPEGHPQASDETLFQELERKQPLATYMVTQMCFDVRRLADWLADMRARGIALPVWIGIPGVSDRAALLRTSLRIGVGDSLRFLRKKSNVVARLLRAKTYTPGELLSGIAPMLTNETMNIGGFHIYCFNQVEAFENWRRQALATLLQAETA